MTIRGDKRISFTTRFTVPYSFRKEVEDYVKYCLNKYSSDIYYINFDGTSFNGSSSPYVSTYLLYKNSLYLNCAVEFSGNYIPPSRFFDDLWEKVLVFIRKYVEEGNEKGLRQNNAMYTMGVDPYTNGLNSQLKYAQTNIQTPKSKFNYSNKSLTEKEQLLLIL